MECLDKDEAAAALTKVLQVVRLVETPKKLEATLLKNLALHPIKVHALMKDAKSSAASGDWFEAGQDYGNLVDLLVLGNKPENSYIKFMLVRA